jgi:hypothetical protein
MSKTTQVRVYPATLETIKDEVLRRRKDGKDQPPLDTPASVIRDAVEYYLEEDVDPSLIGVGSEAAVIRSLKKGEIL